MTRAPIARNASRWSASASLALLISACAAPLHVEIPSRLAPEASEKLTMVLAARGVQIYECRPAKDASAHEWVFVAPEATLLDAHGRLVGRHGAGPFWEANDGSKVVATVKERSDAPDAAAIPWLLLTAKSVGPSGAFSKVTSIQRVNTVAGLAPGVPCTPQTAGTRARSEYTADYRFFTAG